MSENPDHKDYVGLGTQGKIPETTLDSRYLTPTQGMLRFVEKEVDNYGTPAKALILQQYQYSANDNGFNWYDVPLVEVE